MNTIGKDKWPDWVKEVIGDEKCIEIKEHNDRYYAYKYKSKWDKDEKKRTKTSTYLGVVKPTGIEKPREKKLKGIYEYGHIKYIQWLLEKENILSTLKKIYPDDWEIIVTFALNRLIDPKPIKSLRKWWEKTYLIKQYDCSLSPKSVSRVLEKIGTDWNSQYQFFQELRKNGEKILYDGSAIYSDSHRNALLELGHNTDELPIKQAKIVMAFSRDRFIPIFFRVVPGSIHDVKTLKVLSEELGGDLILIMDKGFDSGPDREDLRNILTYLTPLKRNSNLIDYGRKFESFFLWKERPIKYTSWQCDEDIIYLYRDIQLRTKEETSHYQRLDEGKDSDFTEEEAGTIALISNQKFKPKDAYVMWKNREQIEKAFHTFKNVLEADRPWIQKEETFRGYLFGSFIGLLSYYLVLQELKEVEINNKISVRDLMLELSKVYKVELGGKEVMSEQSKTAEELMETLDVKDVITKNLQS